MKTQLTRTNRKNMFTMLALGLLASAMMLPATAEATGSWSYLGTGQLNQRAGRATIPTINGSGRADRVALSVQGAPVYVNSLRVRYANGLTRDLAVNQRIGAGGFSSVINIPGRSRSVQSVEVITPRRRWAAWLGLQTTFRLYGYSAPEVRRHHDRRHSGHADSDNSRRHWSVLGQASTTARRGSAILNVSSNLPEYRQIAVVVNNASVRIRSITVTLANGRQVTTNINQLFEAQGRTSLIDLPGNTRQVRSVQINYRMPRGSSASNPALLTVVGVR